MMEDIDVPKVYTASDQLDNVSEEYVCWLDLMGFRGSMSKSLEQSAIYMLNLHVAVDEEMNRDKITHYPVMDGVYLTTDDQDAMLDLLADVFSKLAKDNIENQPTKYTYVPRASLSYGPILHGENIGEDANADFINGSSYAESLLLGLPMIQAIENESKAPPFGIYVDQSARAFSPNDDPIEKRWYEWFRHFDDDISDLLLQTLDEYYDWCRLNSYSLRYSKEKIAQHKEKAEQYLSE